MDDVVTLKTRFRETVIAWSLARSDASIANPLFDQQQQLVKRLRSTEAGQEALEQLLDDDDVVVQAVAATASLAWASQKGLHVLSTIATRNDLIGFEAELTLKSFRSGKLNLDW